MDSACQEFTVQEARWSSRATQHKWFSPADEMGGRGQGEKEAVSKELEMAVYLRRDS